MPATTVGLSELNTFKAELGIAVSDTSQDTRLTLLLQAASGAIERYCNRTFAKATLTEKYAGHGRQLLNLNRWPIVSVTSVTLDGTVLASTNYQIDSAYGQLWRLEGWTWLPNTIPDITGDPDPNGEDRGITVVYVAGYILPGAADGTRDLPYDIEYAAVRQAAFLYNVPAGLRNERTPGGYSYSAPEIGTKMGLLDEVKQLIDPYRRIPI